MVATTRLHVNSTLTITGFCGQLCEIIMEPTFNLLICVTFNVILAAASDHVVT